MGVVELCGSFSKNCRMLPSWERIENDGNKIRNSFSDIRIL